MVHKIKIYKKLYSSPNETEFYQIMTELNVQYNGTLPGSEIDGNFIKDGAFWVSV